MTPGETNGKEKETGDPLPARPIPRGGKGKKTEKVASAVQKGGRDDNETGP